MAKRGGSPSEAAHDEGQALSPTGSLLPGAGRHVVGRLEEGEVDAYFDADAAAFSVRMSKTFREMVEKVMTIDRAVVCRDDHEIVGTASSEKSEMTLPGLAQIPTAMVVGVTVIPSHRRQGRLTSLMRFQLDDLRERGEPLASLYASEGGIYGRFGYGQATFGATYVLDKRAARLGRPVGDFAPGRVRMISRTQASEAFPAVYDAYRRTRAGELKRAEIDYTSALGEPGGDDAGRRFYAAYEEGGRIDGYVGYEVAAVEDVASRDRRVIVHELCAVTDAGYVALWGFLLGIDLTVEIRAHGRPLDEPIRWLLSDPRQLRTVRSGERVWVRLIDTLSALQARRYPEPGRLVLEVCDPFCPWNSGRYELIVREAWGEAEVSHTRADADLELDATALANLYLGGVSPLPLIATGRIAQLRTGAGWRADRMFANDRPPHCLTPF